jgi:glycerophosphoryl diester phosphodiesterase
MLLLALVLAQDALSDWTIRGKIPADQVVIQSHRGAGVLAPENTLEAFDLAWSVGTTPEADLRMTKDGVIVAFHDENFARVVVTEDAALKKKGVVDLTWAEVAALDVGQGQRVARIEPVLERLKAKPERRLYLDIKKIDLAKLAELLKAAGVEPQVILASPRHAELRRWKALAPASGTLLWVGGTSEEELARKVEEARATSFADLTQVQIHVRLKKGADLARPDPFTPSDAFLVGLGKELRAKGILLQVLPWGVRDAKVYARLLDLGVMSFATDHPKDTVAAVRAYLETR